MIRGEQGDSCVIKLNNEPADLYTVINSGDKIEVINSTAGEDAKATLGSLKEIAEPLHIVVNGKQIELPRTALVNGKLENEFYDITDGDDIVIDNFYTVEQICGMLDIKLTPNITVNGTSAKSSTKVYEDFTLDFSEEEQNELNERYEDEEAEEGDEPVEEEAEETEEAEEVDEVEETAAKEASEAAESNEKSEPNEDTSKNDTATPSPGVIHDLSIVANGKPVTMHGKASYVFVDVFDYIDFDLRNPAGRSVITRVNGLDAAYMQELKEGDNLEIFWEKR